MKKIPRCKFLFAMIMMISPAIFLNNCSPSKYSNKPRRQKDAQWYQSKEWLNGLQLTPHESINQQEFSRQYHLNSTWWNEAFKFLKTHDLAELKPGV